MNRFPREPRDDEEREAIRRYHDKWSALIEGAHFAACPEHASEYAPQLIAPPRCCLAVEHAGDHIAAGVQKRGQVRIVARWPQTPDHSGDAAEMIASTLRGVVTHRHPDGVLAVEIEGACVVGVEGTRTLYLRPGELRAEPGDKVTFRIEVDNG